LQQVSAEGIIERLENGLDTDVGENGAFLSMGEKQLIAFARAIIADPAILILDEATASVDTITEQKIQEALEAVTKGRTTLVVAHRLSTVVNSDVILVVCEGKIVERGTHKELLRMNGYYKQLYMRQFEDEETKKVLG
jgi:ATP-binding cassette subfamily B protein